MTAAIVEYTTAAEWDAFVLAHPHGHLLQSWAWGELKGKFGWQPMRLAVLDTNGGPCAGAQILIRRFIGLSVCYVPRGPLFSGRLDLDRVLLAALRRVARRNRAAFLRLEPNVLEGDDRANTLHSMFQVAGFRVADPLQPRTSLRLDLAPAPERLFAAFSKGHRADVRRAERTGVSVRTGSDIADLDSFYAIMQATAARAEFGIHTRDYYLQAWRLAGDAARLLLASDAAGVDVAAFLIFAYGAEGQYMYSGSDAAGLKSGANHLLQWRALQWVRERGCKLYDFWGVPDAAGKLLDTPEDERAAVEKALEAHPLYGAYRFKKGWGGKLVRYLPAYDQVYLAPAYWLWRKRRGGD
jgi:lipid II:glycine glycyltransferase (peptidoglycan interpeptide bridge formation enzyme)